MTGTKIHTDIPVITTDTPVGTLVAHHPYGQGRTTGKIDQAGQITVRFANANGRPRHLIMWAYQLDVGVTLAK